MIVAWDRRLDKEGQWEAEYYRRCARTSQVLAYERGDLGLFESERRGWTQTLHWRRKDRLDP